VKSPAFQFYPNDFLGSGSVAAMTLEEIGAYVLLLCYEWNEGGLPDDLDRLARYCHVQRRTFDKLWRVISENFEFSGGKWTNIRLEAERSKQLAYREKMSENGRRGGRPKRETSENDESRRLADEKPQVSDRLAESKPTQSTPFSSSDCSHVLDDSEHDGATDASPYPHAFELTWNAYPKRLGGNPKRDALKAWRARIAEGEDSDVLHDGVLRYSAFLHATGKIGTEYVMQARTFFGPSRRYEESWTLPSEAKSGGALSDAWLIKNGYGSAAVPPEVQ